MGKDATTDREDAKNTDRVASAHLEKLRLHSDAMQPRRKGTAEGEEGEISVRKVCS